jgi:hypothetical protein
MTNLRRISEREEVPNHRETLARATAELDRRIEQAKRDMPGGKTYRLPGDGMSPVTASETEQRRLQRSPSNPPRDPRLEDGRNSFNTSGQPRK